MTTRNLHLMFEPRSVALVGASRTAGSVGATLARNLLRSGFQGPVMPVNPKYDAIEGVLAYPDVESLPVTPDLAVIATPPDTVPGLVAALARRGTRAVVVISAGFAEVEAPRGRALQQELLDAARPHTLRVVGPNCLGVLVPQLGLNASFAPVTPSPGNVAFVAQSGAIVASVLDWAHPRGIGFSHLVSLGDMADVDFGDMLDYLASDPHTRAILLYIEAVTHGRKFMSAGRAAARSKPVIVVKAGRHEAGARAALSHTGALAGSDAVYDAALRRAGMLRVVRLEDLFGAVETLAGARLPRGDRLAIATNGGGLGVLAADALIDEGGRLAELSPATRARLEAALPPTWSHANPVDLVGDAGPERYAAALAALLEEPTADAVLAIHCPTAVTSSGDVARALPDSAGAPGRPVVLTSFVGGANAEEGRRVAAERRLPTYATPERAVRAFVQMASYRRNQELLMETPPSIPEEFSPDRERAQAVVRAALAEGRSALREVEAEELLLAYGLEVARSRFAPTAAEAAAAAAEIGAPVALKARLPGAPHKRAVGAVALDVAPSEVEVEAAALTARVARNRPGLAVEGFAVQPMVRAEGALELIAGATVDPVFGPVVLFGHGGSAVELLADTAVALPPLNLRLARELIDRTRVGRLLRGGSGGPAPHGDAVALALIRVAQLVADVPEVLELDVNPLLAHAGGVVALDARVRIAAAGGPAHARLAIRPYPRELEEPVPLPDGRTLLLRPIQPEDEPSLRDNFSKLTPEEVRLRFFVPMKTMSHVMAARFTQLDYDREMALVLTDPGPAGTTEIYGVVRIAADPDNERAEYAILVRHDMTGMGLGIFLMRRMIDYARSRGIGEVWGDVLRDNATMRKLCRALDFRESTSPEDPTVVRVRLPLRRPSAPPG
jgi:acetyltransferase